MSLTRNKRVLVAALLASAISAVGATAGPALASGSTVVNLLPCAFGDGTTTVPSGVPIAIHLGGYAQGTYGLIQDFLLKEHTTLTISDDTTTVYDLSRQWGAPQQLDRNFWVTRLPNTELGIALAPGQSIAATYGITFSQPLLVAYPPVGSSGDNGPYLIGEEAPLTCVITGA